MKHTDPEKGVQFMYYLSFMIILYDLFLQYTRWSLYVIQF